VNPLPAGLPFKGEADLGVGSRNQSLGSQSSQRIAPIKVIANLKPSDTIQVRNVRRGPSPHRPPKHQHELSFCF
jgi:hypothetical protein